MKRVLKIAGVCVGVLLLLLVGALLVGYLFLGDLAKKAIETVGPQVTKSRVTVGAIRVSAIRGRLEVEGMEVGNPEGFNTPSAFKLGAIRVALKPASVLTGRVIVSEVVVDGPEITYEGSLHGSNIGQLQKNVEEFTGGPAPAKPEAPAPPPKKPEAEGKKVQINDLVVRNGKVHMSATFMAGKSLTLPLPEVHLKDIGKEKEGKSLGQVVGEVFKAILGKSGDVVSSSGEAIGSGAKAVGESAKEAGTAVKEGASKLFQGLKGTVTKDK